MKKQLGVSLLELIVALAIGLILLLALSSVYMTANQSSKTRSVEESLDEAARQIFERLQQDLNMAGFVDVFDKDNGQNIAEKIAAIKTYDSVGVNLGRLTGKDLNGDGQINGDDLPKSPFETVFQIAAIEGFEDPAKKLPAKLIIRYQARKLNANSKSTLPNTAFDCNQQEVTQDKYVENIYTLAGEDFVCEGNGGTRRMPPQPLVNGVDDLEFRYLITEPLDTTDPLYNNATVYDSQSGLYAKAMPNTGELWRTVADIRNTELKAHGVTAVRVCVVVGVEPLTGRGNAVVEEFQPTIPRCDGTTRARQAADGRKLYRQYTKVLSIPNALYFTPERKGS